MACKPWGDSRKGKTVRALMDEALRGRTPGQRSKMEIKLSSQDRTPLPTFLSPLPCLSGSQRMPGTGRNPWRGATVPGCGREQGGLGLGDCTVAAGPPADAEVMAGH